MKSSIPNKGFTLMELVVVLALISIMATLAAPVVTTSIVRAKEATLKQNLFVTRSAIDDYFSDNEVYPEDLEVLVSQRYLRTLPHDPVVGSDTDWDLIESEDLDISGIEDLRSSSTDQSLDGSYYSEW